jgi:hypothetical protein
VRGVAEARELARRAFWLLLCRYTGQLTEEQHRALARGLEAFLLLPPPRRERKPFIPPSLRRAGEGAEGVESSATGQELKEKGKISVKIPVNPSLLPSLPPALHRLALRGFAVKLKIVRLGDLPPLRPLSALLPARWAVRAGGRVVRLELEVSR